MSKEKHYGVWVSSGRQGNWFVNGATGIVFSTPDLGFASAQAISLGDRVSVMQIGPRGKPIPIEMQDAEGEHA